MLAACDSLLSFSRRTGIHTNFACDFRGLAAYQSALQCGHCASKNTYTVRALIGEPTVKPCACDWIASIETACVDGAAAAAAVEGDSGDSLQPASSARAASAAAARVLAWVRAF